MAVIDTGKGIGKEFLKDQLFHPFSQENPLLSGTGLGLAIVNSIVRSEGVDGKVDVWSSEGIGTEIRVSFDVEAFDDDADPTTTTDAPLSSSVGKGHTLSLLHFDPERRGQMLNLELLSAYAGGWQFELVERGGEIIVINEDLTLLESLRDSRRPLLFCQSTRSWPESTNLREAINNGGGFCQALFKPLGPTAFRKALQSAVEWLEGVREAERPPINREDSGASDDSTRTVSQESASTLSELSRHRFGDRPGLPLRRRSEEKENSRIRPSMAPRGITFDTPRNIVYPDEQHIFEGSPLPGSPHSSTSTLSTISLADGGVMLKAAVTTAGEAPRKGAVPRVMVVEDNVINRRVLGAFLKKKVR